jgi:hypothetical protein
MSKLKPIGFSCMLALAAFTPPAFAQYMYLDTDGDSLNTSADRLNADGPTVLTIYLNTNHDRDGSPQTCNSHTASCGASTTGQALDMFSYTISLVAVGGTVQWGTFTPADAAYTPLGQNVSDSVSVEINRSRPVSTFTAPGLSALGSITVTITSGLPHIDVAHGATTADPFGFGTGFGTECSGFNYPNTYVLGDPADLCGSGGDWTDADGVAGPPPPPNLSAPANASASSGRAVLLSAVVTAAEDGLDISAGASGFPSSMTLSVLDSTATTKIAQITGTPGLEDVGHYDILWTATESQSSPATARTSFDVLQASSSGGEPIITNVWFGGSADDSSCTSGAGFTDTTSTSDGLNATIGEWTHDPPCPPVPPGDEPCGRSELNVEIDVNSGGYLTFSYMVKSTDTACFDWLDIFVVAPGPVATPTPAGSIQRSQARTTAGSDTISIVNQYGAFYPCSDGFYTYCEERDTPIQPGAIDLFNWQGKHVRVVFSVEQDGGGEQTAAFVSAIHTSGCSLAGITPLAGAKAKQLELNPLDMSLLTVPMQANVDCFWKRLGSPSPWLTSAYRDEEYQAHLGQVYVMHSIITDEDRLPSSPCKTIADSIDAEWDRHQPFDHEPAPASGSHKGPHTLGLAIDVLGSIIDSNASDIDVLAGRCCLYRPLVKRDRVHFRLRGVCVPDAP